MPDLDTSFDTTDVIRHADLVKLRAMTEREDALEGAELDAVLGPQAEEITATATERAEAEDELTS